MAVWNTDVRELDYSSDGCVEYIIQVMAVWIQTSGNWIIQVMAVWNTDVRELDYSSDGCVEYRRQGTRLFK